ncbi:MAG: MGMT family protein [Planctomycetes bacterium]|nr:MGMT family protein [Planctomycetota bacterium]
MSRPAAGAVAGAVAGAAANSAALARAELFYAVIARIPRGRVATYGQIAALAGLPRHARHVGAALRALPDDRAIPWHRVVSAGGTIPDRDDGIARQIQRELLCREGVPLDAKGRVVLDECGWRARG